MSKEIEAVIRTNEIGSKNVEVGEWGLNFKGQLTTEEWLDIALSIQKFDGKIQWYLGDLAVYAESDVTGWDKKREDGKSKYDDLVAATGYGKDTFKVYGSVARRFSPQFRDNTLSSLNEVRITFSHFQSVAPLDDNFAAYWLMKANDNAWGRDKLREEIRRWREGRGEIPEKEEKPIGYISFGEKMKEFFKGYMPNLTQEEYDEKSWLLEVHDVIEEKLHDLGIEL